MKKIRYIIAVFMIATGYAQAQSGRSNHNPNFFNTDIDYSVQAQFSIGGSSPLGLPKTIRKIESYNPGLQVGLEANATKWLPENKQWGIRAGIRFEAKGMKTEARVKNYLTEIVKDNSKVRGYYTGKVETNVQNTYLTLPVLAVYKLSDHWNLYGGLYFSALLDNTFDGNVSDGYLRQNTPTGTKITFEEGSQASYDFSDNIRKFHWGAQLGTEWKMNRHFKLLTDLTYGFNNILEKDFTSIDFGMHNIYLNVGFGYNF
ncbi:porin family protein [Sphingobacterium prati]|uniref:porin family protein n=1 Tax=Sphingobacterium prati TaxID=2737006 RepID=UPI001555E1E0|nr:porin family protein [Sphingobacterium prati]NPE48953.1 PorT family protein [Sphingobacterium prati]